MSLETWKKEFYPVDAEKVSKKDALRHSLRKWLGLTPTSLKKHGLSLESYGAISYGDRDFFVDADTCALCVHHLETDCSTCPLYKIRGVSCDKNEDMVRGESPYHQFTIERNASPMISLLRKAWRKYGPRRKKKSKT